MSSRAEKTAALDRELYGFLERLDDGRDLNIIGIDEVGRGSLSGPLTVAAVSLPLLPRISGLNDSKKLSAIRREALSLEIHKTAKSYIIIDIEPSEIDRIGIAEAVRVAMARAIEEMRACIGEPDVVLIDGNPQHVHPREQAVVKGDGKAACIAAASIVAKVHRDALMVSYSEGYPAYCWQSNKGYGSAAHIAAVRELGLTPLHRKSFCAGIVQETLF